jgi:hypothetical protein
LQSWIEQKALFATAVKLANVLIEVFSQRELNKSITFID